MQATSERNGLPVMVPSASSFNSIPIDFENLQDLLNLYKSADTLLHMLNQYLPFSIKTILLAPLQGLVSCFFLFFALFCFHCMAEQSIVWHGRALESGAITTEF